mmetsp:Transcript_40759/g.96932  ORF Transcript_40759/g.96932 Transcript_40759/m.96932 type:complete len:208 (+) Transcript_40759:1267-1890(+)
MLGHGLCVDGILAKLGVEEAQLLDDGPRDLQGLGPQQKLLLIGGLPHALVPASQEAVDQVHDVCAAIIVSKDGESAEDVADLHEDGQQVPGHVRRDPPLAPSQQDQPPEGEAGELAERPARARAAPARLKTLSWVRRLPRGAGRDVGRAEADEGSEGLWPRQPTEEARPRGGPAGALLPGAVPVVVVDEHHRLCELHDRFVVSPVLQ